MEALAKQYNVSYQSQSGTATGPSTPAWQYMHTEVTDHRQAVALFQKEATGGSSQDVRSLAATLLPTLQQHLKMAQEYVNTAKMTPQPMATNGASVP